MNIIISRLSHLFKSNGILENQLLCCPWDTYVHRHPHAGHTMQALARARMDRIWDAWQQCIRADEDVVNGECPQYVGAYLDAHIPLVQHADKLTVACVMRLHLAPEQNAMKLTMPKELVDAVSVVWRGHAGAKKTLIGDLFLKGRPGVLSVRYIRPQLQRCAAHVESKMIVTEMIKAWICGKHSNRTAVAPPPRRLKVAAMTFDELIADLSSLTSRQLYYIIAECIAVVTVSTASLHILAAGACSVFQEYFLDSTAVYNRKRKGIVGRVLYHTPAVVRIQQWPLTTPTQVPDTGLATTKVHTCDTCAAIHIKTERQPRALKGRAGVSIDLANPWHGVCNQCNSPSTVREISNYITKGNVNNKMTTVCICAACSTIAAGPTTIGLYLYCTACAATKMQTMLDTAHPCLCGAVGDTTTFTTVLRKGVYTIHNLCREHASLKYDCMHLHTDEAIAAAIAAFDTVTCE